jgi:hypothetical protein
MNSDTVREFDEKGYVLVRDVLDAQTVQRPRRLLLEEFKKQNTNVLNDGIIHYPEFSEILNQPKLVSALVELSDIKVYMDFENSLPANAHLQKTRATPGITLPSTTENFVVM